MAKVETPKGMRDYLPEEQIVRQDIINKIKKIFEKYGFSPLDTPAMEMLSTLKAKGGGGAMIGKEIFTLKDRAGRELGLRYDPTATPRTLRKKAVISPGIRPRRISERVLAKFRNRYSRDSWYKLTEDAFNAGFKKARQMGVL